MNQITPDPPPCFLFRIIITRLLIGGTFSFVANIAYLGIVEREGALIICLKHNFINNIMTCCFFKLNNSCKCLLWNFIFWKKNKDLYLKKSLLISIVFYLFLFFNTFRLTSPTYCQLYVFILFIFIHFQCIISFFYFIFNGCGLMFICIILST